MLAYARRIPLEPDLVILQGGENDEFNDAFRSTYRSLLDFYPVPYIVIGDLWSDEKSIFNQQEVMARNYPFVNLRAIYQDPSNSGDGGPYAHPGVAQHPNDEGMACIARNVLEKLR
jgi:lysophospholipase L1-like esterase